MNMKMYGKGGSWREQREKEGGRGREKSGQMEISLKMCWREGGREAKMNIEHRREIEGEGGRGRKAEKRT